MPDHDLAVRVRDYARERYEGDPEDAVSSAWLAREFDVDPRTIAAALRPYGVRPAELQHGVRGYQLVHLAALELGDDVGDARLVVSPPSPLGGAADGVPAVSGSAGAPSAVERLSAAAGHDMTGALRAAGLL